MTQTQSSNPLQALIAAATRLVALLETETRELRRINLAEMTALQNEKGALSAALERALADLRADPGALRAAAPALREEVRLAMMTFAQVAAANERALRAARHANERLLQAIADAVSEREPTSGYARNGRTAPPRAASIAVNERF